MKVGIITQPLHNNYGGLLQNYALQRILKGMGHDVETIDWTYARAGVIREWLFRQKMFLLSCINKNVEKPRYQPTKAEAKEIGCNTNGFIEKYISICSQKVQHIEDFAVLDKIYSYDAYVVGSDQVWRPSYNSSMITAMFLDFVENRKNIHRIAYAASFGTSEWEFTPTMTETCARLAKKFDLVTVREMSGVKLCRDYFGVEAKHVLDPTMLLCKDDYEKLVEGEQEPESQGTLFHYILDPIEEKKDFIEMVAKEQGLEPFTIMPKCQAENRTRKDVKNRIEDCVFPSVTSWLRGFMDAKMVVVDSFHGAVFSIIFNKPFWILSNNKRGNARFESLLDLFGLEERMIYSNKLRDTFDLNKSIDWERVNAIRQKEKNRCISLLDDSLK